MIELVIIREPKSGSILTIPMSNVIRMTEIGNKVTVVTEEKAYFCERNDKGQLINTQPFDVSGLPF